MFKAIATQIMIIVSLIFGMPQNIPSEKIPAKPDEVVVQKNDTLTKSETATTTILKTPSAKTTKTQPAVKKIQNLPITQETKIEIPIVKTEQPPKISFENINVNTRKAVVNILCSTKTAGALSPITGTGIMIGGNGVILTNAHIAEYFLLKDFNNQKDFIECVIRTGNPAYPKYHAELIYISPAWITDNKSILTEQNPKGTGEHDYAFLHVTEKVDGTSESGIIPFVSLSLTENNTIGLYTLLASYPAGFLGGQSILRDLYQSSSIVNIADVFTFGSSTIDLISIGGSVVSQKGSSGGAVVNDEGELIGVISTESEAVKTSDRDLRAITLAYINRDLMNESGSSIIDLLSHPTEYAKNFNENIAPKLTEILTNAILKK